VLTSLCHVIRLNFVNGKYTQRAHVIVTSPWRRYDVILGLVPLMFHLLTTNLIPILTIRLGACNARALRDKYAVSGRRLRFFLRRCKRISVNYLQNVDFAIIQTRRPMPDRRVCSLTVADQPVISSSHKNSLPLRAT